MLAIEQHISDLESENKELKNDIADLEQTIRKKDLKIKELESLAENKDTSMDWKGMYFTEVSNYLTLQQNYKSLSQDIKYHIEYNFLLENKCKNLEKEYLELFENYHKKLAENRIDNYTNLIKTFSKLKNLDEERLMGDINALFKNEENEESNSIKSNFEKKLREVSFEKEDMQRELMLAKTQIMDMAEKLEKEIEENNNLKNNLAKFKKQFNVY